MAGSPRGAGPQIEKGSSCEEPLLTGGADAVTGESVSTPPKFPVTGKITGNFAKSSAQVGRTTPAPPSAGAGWSPKSDFGGAN